MPLKNENMDPVIFSHLTHGRSQAAAKGVMWSAATAAIPSLLNGAVFLVTSRFLAPSDFGLIALALSVVSFFTSLAPAAFGDALVQRKDLKQSHLDSVFWLCAIACALLYGIIAFGSAGIARALGHTEIAQLLPVLGLKLVFDVMSAVPVALIGRAMAFHLFTIRTGISTLISSAICLVLIWQGYGIWAIAIAQLASSFASCVASFWSAKWRPGFKFNLSSLSELTQFAMFASGTRFMNMMSLDQLLLGSLAGTSTLGIFNFSRRLFQIIVDFLSGALNSVTAVMFASLDQEADKLRQAFLLATFSSALVSFPAFMGLAIIADDLIPLLFGKQWISAVWPVRGFCVIGLMTCIGLVQSSLINAKGKTHWWFIYQVGRNILTISSIFVLWRFGVNVIIISMALQVIVLWPITIWMVSRLIQISVVNYLEQFVGPTLAFLAMLLSIFGLDLAFNGLSVPWNIAMQVIIGGIVYLIMVYWLSGHQIKQILQAIFKKRFNAKDHAAETMLENKGG
jgi:teichuronic acid exporter